MKLMRRNDLNNNRLLVLVGRGYRIVDAERKLRCCDDSRCLYVTVRPSWHQIEVPGIQFWWIIP